MSYGYYNRMAINHHKLGDLRQKFILTVLGAEMKSKCHSKAILPLEVLSRSGPCSSASGLCQHCLTCGHSTPVLRINIYKSLSAPSSHHLLICVWSNLPLPPTYDIIYVTAFRTHVDIQDTFISRYST